MNLVKYYKDGYNVFKHEYIDLNDFLNTLLNSKINYSVFKKIASETGSHYFCQTNSFNEAWNMCRFGWNKDFDKFRDKVRMIDFDYAYKQRMVRVYKPIGGSPSVARFLLGIPNNMHSKVNVKDKKTIDIYFNISCSYDTSYNQIINRGVLTLALIEYLEKTNFFGINLHFIELSKVDDEILYLDIPLKKKNERLNIKKCYFPIVHPSFLRRLCFRACEITPVTNNWNRGYGAPMTFSDAKFLLDDELDNAIYISTPREMGINGRNIDEDLDAFIRIINDKYKSVLNKDNGNDYSRKRR